MLAFAHRHGGEGFSRFCRSSISTKTGRLRPRNFEAVGCAGLQQNIFPGAAGEFAQTDLAARGKVASKSPRGIMFEDHLPKHKIRLPSPGLAVVGRNGVRILPGGARQASIAGPAFRSALS